MWKLRPLAHYRSEEISKLVPFAGLHQINLMVTLLKIFGSIQPCGPTKCLIKSEWQIVLSQNNHLIISDQNRPPGVSKINKSCESNPPFFNTFLLNRRKRKSIFHFTNRTFVFMCPIHRYYKSIFIFLPKFHFRVCGIYILYPTNKKLYAFSTLYIIEPHHIFVHISKTITKPPKIWSKLNNFSPFLRLSLPCIPFFGRKDFFSHIQNFYFHSKSNNNKHTRLFPAK